MTVLEVIVTLSFPFLSFFPFLRIFHVADLSIQTILLQVSEFRLLVNFPRFARMDVGKRWDYNKEWEG